MEVDLGPYTAISTDPDMATSRVINTIFHLTLLPTCRDNHRYLRFIFTSDHYEWTVLLLGSSIGYLLFNPYLDDTLLHAQVTVQLFDLVNANSLQIRAMHLPVMINVLADTLTQPSTPQSTEWMLDSEAFQCVYRRLWMPNIDLFATRFNQQLPDPQALDMDVLAISWQGLGAYTSLPPILIEYYSCFNNSTAASCSLLQKWPNYPKPRLFPLHTWTLAPSN